jgi:hypothetical protein
MLHSIRQKVAGSLARLLADWHLLLVVGLLAYGVSIPWLGFYWDDFPLAWIAHQYGSEGLARYFSTNRPYWGLLYQFTTPILGSTPWHWQVFALFWRWVTAVLFWWLIRLAWPHQKTAALWGSLLFLLYAGFSQQFISLVYSHFFIILSAFLLSLACTLLVLRRPAWTNWKKGAVTGLALLLSLVNLISMEYFFLLDLLRPLLIWAVLSRENGDWRSRLKQTALTWLPYLLVFLGAGLWRAFFFPYQTQNYQPLLLQQLKTQPLAALSGLAAAALRHIGLAGFEAWGRIFQLPDSQEISGRSFLIYMLVLAGGALLTFGFLLLQNREPEDEARQRRQAAWQMVWMGLLAMLVAGGPFWVTSMNTGLVFPADRFNLPFALGSSLALVGLFSLLPRDRRVNFALALLVSLTTGFAAAHQFQNSISYRRDWSLQKGFFWQMSWRMPQLDPGTTLIAHELDVTHYSDNSLTGPLNWIYAPDNHTTQMSYMLYYPTVRLGAGLPGLEKGLPIDQNYLAARFLGSTDQAVALVYNPPACLRVLDPALDSKNWMVPEEIRKALPLASTQPIHDGPALSLPEELFGVEPEHTWCYYFEKADLARQQEDWQKVVELGDQAFSLGDYPNDPSERLPFIEGYAHTGNWEQALDLSRQTAKITPVMNPVLCQLWKRLEQDTPAGDAREATMQAALNEFECKP